ncbi:MAG: PQQ-like beta-propeller repeat protein [Bacteroidales bacterium]|nr:PQQ-like beta-propeller repeat protein [Bacteroidales bacterium]MCF8389067.1 PQQ-like beta-propeller repeat protein [Bacteroidales bacterium]
MRSVILFLFIVLIHFNCINAQDWPGWRGELRDGIWNDPDVIGKFESEELDIKWSVQIGPGYSGPTLAHGKVYITDRPDNPVNQERVLCFDEESGSSIWTFAYDCEYLGIGYPAGPRASVIIDEGRAYTLGSMGHLYCFDAATGAMLWKRDMNADYKIEMPIWGIASAPLIVGDKIILQIGGSENASVVALYKTSGEEIWRNLNDKASYSAPILINQANKKIIVNWSGESLSGLDVETGEIYWRFPFTVRSQMAIATPVLYKDYIFVSSFYSGSMLIKLDKNSLTAEKVWQRAGESERKTDALHCVMNTPVILENYIYGVDSYGELRCLELETGDRVWEDLTAVTKDRWANIHFVQNGENTWMFNEHGELIISRLSPEGFKEISRAQLIEPTTAQLNRKGTGVTWSHPAFANKHVFIRSDKELVCADLSVK